MGTYSAWESTATLRLRGGARGAGAPTGGGEGRGHIVSPRAQLVYSEQLYSLTTISERFSVNLKDERMLRIIFLNSERYVLSCTLLHVMVVHSAVRLFR